MFKTIPFFSIQADVQKSAHQEGMEEEDNIDGTSHICTTPMVDSDTPQLHFLYNGDVELELCSLDQSSVDSLKFNNQKVLNVNHADENGMENTTCNNLVMIRGQFTKQKQGKYAKNSARTSGSDDSEDLYDDGEIKFMADHYDSGEHGSLTNSCSIGNDVDNSTDPKGEYDNGDIEPRGAHSGKLGDFGGHGSRTNFITAGSYHHNTYGLHHEKTQYRQTKEGAESQPNDAALTIFLTITM